MINYYYKKLFQAICFSINPQQYFNSNMFNAKFLNVVKNNLLYFKENSIMDETMKDNILQMTIFIRFNPKNKDNKYTDLINDFIRLVNTSKVDPNYWISFLESSFNDRCLNKKVKLDLSNDIMLDNLFYSLELDFLVLKSLICTDERFEDIVQDVMFDEFYFDSLNRIFRELPQLSNEEDIRIKVYTVNLANQKMKEKIADNQKKDYQRILKAGKRLIKKMTTNQYEE